MQGERYETYDRFAEIYHRHWERFSVDSRPALERLLYLELPRGAHVLDLGCGTGQVAARLLAKGYRVTGLDSSKAMLGYARKNAPGARFLLADARWFELDEPADAVVAFSDVPNHVLELAELHLLFACVARALRPGGLYLFDVNPEEKYLDHWTDSFGLVGDDHACIVRAAYDPAARLARFDATVFLHHEYWDRTDLTIHERCYADGEIRAALESAGFEDLRTYDLRRDLAPDGESAKVFWTCRKSMLDRAR